MLYRFSRSLLVIFFAPGLSLFCSEKSFFFGKESKCITSIGLLEGDHYLPDKILSGEHDSEMEDVEEDIFRFWGRNKTYWIKGKVDSEDLSPLFLRLWYEPNVEITIYWELNCNDKDATKEKSREEEKNYKGSLLKKKDFLKDQFTNLYGSEKIVLSTRDQFVQIPKDASGDFVMKIRVGDLSLFRTNFLASELSVVLNEENRQIRNKHIIYFGKVLLLIIVFILYFLLRKKYHLYFFFYLALHMLTFEFSELDIDPNLMSPLLFHKLYTLLEFSILVFLCKFFQNIFITRERLPKIDKLLNSLPFLFGGVWSLSFVPNIWLLNGVAVGIFALAVSVISFQLYFKRKIESSILAFVMGGVISAIFNFNEYNNIVDFIILSEIMFTTLMLFVSFHFMRSDFLTSSLIVLGWILKWAFLIILAAEKYFHLAIIKVRWGDLNDLQEGILNLSSVAPFLLYSAIHSLREEKVSSNAEDFVRSFENNQDLKGVLKSFLSSSSVNISYDVACFLIRKSELKNNGDLPNGFFDLDQIRDRVDSFLENGEGYMVSNNNISVENYHQFLKDGDFNSSILCRLSFNNSDSGFVLFLSRKYGVYDVSLSGFIKDFAQKSSIAIQHFRQLEEIANSKSKLEAEKAIKVYQQTITHDIKSPLLAVRIGANSIRDLYRHKWGIDKKMEEYITLLEFASKEAMEEVEESMSVSDERVQSFSLQYINDSLGEVAKVCEYENIEFIVESEFPADLTIYGPKKTIRNMVRSIAKNCVEAFEGVDKDNRKIELIYKKRDGKMEIEFHDNGKGIKEEHMEKIFGHFSYGKEYGSGHGLTLVREVVKRLGGYIDVKSEESKGTVVAVVVDILKGEEEKMEGR